MDGTCLLKQQYKFSILFLPSTEPVIWFLTTIQNTDGTVDIGYYKNYGNFLFHNTYFAKVLQMNEHSLFNTKNLPYALIPCTVLDTKHLIGQPSHVPALIKKQILNTLNFPTQIHISLHSGKFLGFSVLV
jgi:hypothetical protein